MSTPFDDLLSDYEQKTGPARALSKLRVVASDESDDRPTIRLDVNLSESVRLGVSAIASDQHTYQRDFGLSHIVIGDGNRAGAPLIRPMTTPNVRVRLSACASWLKLDKRKDAWVPALPSDQVVRGIEDLGSYPGVRPLVGIAETPFPRMDGTIVQTPGYDEPSGYVYIPTAQFPTVPSNPTRADAVKALLEVLEIVHDFPFSGQASKGAPNPYRSAWLAMLLTVFARPAIDGAVPAFFISANSRGTGKTKGADAVALLVSGRESFKRPFAEDDKELRKVLTGILSDGDPLTVFDNVARPIEGASLDNAITSRAWRDRGLGTNASISAANVTTFVFTGNGVMVGGDTARRVLPIELEATTEKPEDRTDFLHPNLFDWIRAERPRLVVAVLTVVRAWFVAGRPSMDVRPLGSFEAWSVTVPAIIRWLGEPCPLLTRTGIDDADEGRNAIATLLSGWERMQATIVGADSLTTADVIRILYPPNVRLGDEGPPEPEFYGDLRWSIEALTGQNKPTSIKLSGALRTSKRRIVAGKRIDVVPGRAGIARWRVETIGLGGVGGVGGVSTTPLRGDQRILLSTGENNPTNTTNPTSAGAG